MSNELFVLGDSVVLTVLGQVAFMPVLVLAAKLCPEVSQLHQDSIQCLFAKKSSLLTCGVSLAVPARVKWGLKPGPIAGVPAMARVRLPAEGQIWLAGSGGDIICNFDVNSQRWLIYGLCSGIWANSGLWCHGDRFHIVSAPHCGELQPNLYSDNFWESSRSTFDHFTACVSRSCGLHCRSTLL